MKRQKIAEKAQKLSGAVRVLGRLVRISRAASFVKKAAAILCIAVMGFDLLSVLRK